MSVIAIKGLSPRITLNDTTRMLGRAIQGRFKALNFLNSDCGNFKTCYLELLDLLDPVVIVEKINKMFEENQMDYLKAFVPDTVPDLPVPEKPLFLRKTLRKQLGIPAGQLSSAEIISIAHMELLSEIQYKYTALCALSLKSSHALLAAIGTKIYDRLEPLVDKPGVTNPCKLTKCYREVYPHRGDFQFIRDVLHLLEDTAGTPRTKLQRAELFLPPKEHRIGVERSKMYERAVIARYTGKMLFTLRQYVSGYQLRTSPMDSKEVAARKEVQAHLSNLMFHMPTIMNELTMTHFPKKVQLPPKSHKIRVYGEPYLPEERVTIPVLKRYHAFKLSRRKTMFNLLMFDVPVKFYPKVLEMDGTKLAGATLVVRSSNTNKYIGNLLKKCTEKESIEIKDEGEEEEEADM